MKLYRLCPAFILFGALTIIACGRSAEDAPESVVDGSGGEGSGSDDGTGGVVLDDTGFGDSGAGGADSICAREDPPDWCDTGMYVATGDACGDGVVNEGAPGRTLEECDDGNTLPGDGCNGVCTMEPFFECPVEGEPCVSTIVCGDGEISGSEVCDDGNATAGDGCAADCMSVEDGFYCPTEGAACVAIIDPCAGDNPPASCNPVVVDTRPACGDGMINEGAPGGVLEQCDDGNSVPGDGCSGACSVEPNFTCPTPGEPCVSTLACGDGTRSPGEQCDDGNTADGDGCTGECVVEDGWYCPNPGAACEQLVACGDGRFSAGEACDDANTTAGDGCSAGCQVEAGYRCVGVPSVCSPIPVCGDLTVTTSAGEECDDGNTTAGDGCSPLCRIEASYWDCPADGGACTNTVVCGDGAVELNELCDDGNTTDGDGCASDCSVEIGWVCRMPGQRCIPLCGDGLVMAGVEECEDGNAVSGDGCSRTCQVEIGYSCPTPGQPCVPLTTVCNDGEVSPGEPCDDGNDIPFDGCYECLLEPHCPGGVCQSVCGDGVKYADEECDDANTANGDGCSASCNVEPGYTCVDVYPETGDDLTLPVLYRDFIGWYLPGDTSAMQTARSTAGVDQHPDFNPDVDFDQYDSSGTYGMVESTLAQDGTPVYVTPSPALHGTSSGAAGFDQWYHDDASVNLLVPSTLSLTADGNGGFVYDSALGVGRFDPIANQGFVAAGMEPISGCNAGIPGSNVSFTSETRFWFEYQGGESFEFSGDDDVWVFVNGQLVVDLGNLHYPFDGDFDLDNAGVATATTTLNWSSRTISVDLGLVAGHVYEVSLFHAERNRCGSNFKVTVQNFTAPRSVCDPTCGDGVATTFEECDDGVNDGGYGECAPGCVWGDYCGDGEVNGPEECDDGTNTTVAYGATGCGPGCQLPPRCGDGVLDAAEECDEGSANADGYGGCSSTCELNPYCGDGVTDNPPESCDDGLNTGGYGLCAPGCELGPRCGDGVIQIEYGEQCDDGALNGTADSSCSTTCGAGARCGDGIVQTGEECDDGVNDGRYGTCAPGCVWGPYCGDGVRQDPPEECDDGTNSGDYGACAPGCVLGPRCGDGVVQTEAGEECDDGVNDGFTSNCSPGCVLGPHCGDAIVQEIRGEECDDGINESVYGAGCGRNCLLPPSCGDSIVQSAFGERCDDGTNAGGYGECAPGCVFGPRCGDATVQSEYGEACDDGVNDGGYGECGAGCQPGPHCGDNVLQPAYEECDDGNTESGDGCSEACRSEVWIPA